MNGVHLIGKGDPLSNYSLSEFRMPCPACGEMLCYASGEHRFQACKEISVCDNEIATGGDVVRYGHHALALAQKNGSPAPSVARAMGRDRDRCRLRDDWEAASPRGVMSVKGWVMLDMLRAKFVIPRYRTALLATGTSIVIEDAPWDAVWGAGHDGRGLNALGRLLMKLRGEILSDDQGYPLPGRTPPVTR